MFLQLLRINLSIGFKKEYRGNKITKKYISTWSTIRVTRVDPRKTYPVHKIAHLELSDSIRVRPNSFS